MTRSWPIAPALTALGGVLIGFLLSSSITDVPVPPQPESLELIDEEKPDADLDDVLTKEHLLWTYQQVLDRYGPPDRIYSVSNNTRVVWRYHLRLKNGTSERIVFSFLDGFVSSVDD